MPAAPAAPQPASAQRAQPQRATVSSTPKGVVGPLTDIGRLQQALGNLGMHRVLGRAGVQAKLTVGPAGDRYEREADRVADEVMRMPEPAAAGLIQRSPLVIQRLCPECEEELQRQAEGQATALERRIGEMASGEDVLQRATGALRLPGRIDDTLESRVHALRGYGQPLPPNERAFMESRFGHSFGGVRIHTSGDAGALASAIAARAFTLGRDVVFGAGEYHPGSSAGRRLLAHELTHVVQQGATPAPPVAQRSCGPKEIGTTPPADCVFFSTVPPSENRFLFVPNCDTFASGQADALANFVRQIPSEAKVDIIGMASAEGGRGFNDVLSCRRAEAAKDVLVLEGLGTNIRRVLATGGVPETEHDPTFRAVQISMSSQPPEPEEVCRDLLGTCEYYLCRDRKHPCGDRGYYRGFGHKYCNRFTNDTRPRMTTTGQEWLDCVRNCLQDHLEQNVAVDADCGDAKDSAIGSHARCYVQCGLCSLPPGDLTRIQDAVDSEDKDLSQVLETIARCLTLPSPPATRGFQLECVMRLGGCSQTRPAGIPTPEEIKSFNDQCRRDIGFTGEDVVPSAEDCERFFGP